jgi:hypothetical protein
MDILDALGNQVNSNAFSAFSLLLKTAQEPAESGKK